MDLRDDIRDRLSVEDVVGDYLELKRSGRNLKALSPFSKEKTASFMVSPEKQIWHDFPANKGGDIFTFVMEMEGVDFRGALDLLARKAGLDPAAYQSSESHRETASLKERAYSANAAALQFYHRSLANNKTVKDYLVQERGYGRQIIEDFELGWSPSDGSSLITALTNKGYTREELIKAGLVTQRGARPTDLFRGRLMVPLHDGHGKPIGFTARVLDDSLPKYINTPQTLIYDKSRHVFGLHLAKPAIREHGFVVMVEGNLDVIGSHKGGVKNVVATAGTAMTKFHLQQISRLTTDVRLAFDGDAAGLAATERAIPIAQEVGVQLSIVDLVGGKDPDELVKQSPELWQQTVTKSVYVVDWVIEHYGRLNDLTSGTGKRTYTDKVLAVISRLADPVEQDHYLNQLAKELEIGVEALRKKLEQGQKKPAKRLKRPKAELSVMAEEKQVAYQDQLLGLLLLYPDTREALSEKLIDNFIGEQRQLVAQTIGNSDQRALDETDEDLRSVGDYVKIITFKTEELYGDWNSSDRLIEAIGLARRLQTEKLQTARAALSDAIRQAEEDGDDERVAALLAKFNQLLKE